MDGRGIPKVEIVLAQGVRGKLGPASSDESPTSILKEEKDWRRIGDLLKESCHSTATFS
jgi:hypothetical protein